MKHKLRIVASLLIAALVVAGIVVATPAVQEGRVLRRIRTERRTAEEEKKKKAIHRAASEEAGRRSAPETPPSPPEAPAETPPVPPSPPQPSEFREELPEPAPPSFYMGDEVLLTVSNESDTPHSQVLTPQPSSIESTALAKFRYTTTGEGVQIRRLTFGIEPAPETGRTIEQVQRNFGTIYLIDERSGEVLASGVFEAGTVVFVLESGIAIPANTTKTLRLHGQIAGTGALTSVDEIVPGSVVRIRVDADDHDRTKFFARTIAGGLALQDQNIALTDAADTRIPAGQYMLIHKAEPIMAAVTARVTSINDESAQLLIFSVTNSGMSAMEITGLNADLAVSTESGSAAAVIDRWALWDEGRGAAIAELGDRAVSVRSGIVEETISFEGALATLMPGEIKTFSIRADTTNVRNGIPAGQPVILLLRLHGAQGYAAGDTVAETAWANGPLVYRYGAVANDYRGNDSPTISATVIWE